MIGFACFNGKSYLPSCPLLKINMNEMFVKAYNQAQMMYSDMLLQAETITKCDSREPFYPLIIYSPPASNLLKQI